MNNQITKKYKNKRIVIKFYFNDNGKSFNEIMERCYREKIINESILIGK